MKARKLVLIAIVALLASLAPSAAYADLYDELDGNYDGEMWRNEVNANSNNGFDSPGTGYASVNLILNDIYQFNADLLARGQSPAGQLAIQLTQLDFIRGAYGRLTQIKEQVESIYLDTAYLRSGMTQVNSYLGGMQYNLSLVKTATESLKANLDTILDNQVVIGSALENIRQNLISANGNLQDIDTGINGTGSTSVRSLLSTLAGNQAAISTQIRSYFHNDPNGDGTPGIIYGLIDGIKTSLDNFKSDNHSDLESVISAITGIDLSIEIPSYQPIINAINSINTKFQSLINWLPGTFVSEGGAKYLRVHIAYQNYGNGSTNAQPWVNVRQLSNNFSELFNYLTNQDGVLKQIRDLLNVSNPDELVGDFDTVEFDNNVDDLVSRLATVAPFGALLMVSAELDILHSVSEIQKPSFVFPFEFFGQETVTIDLGFLADARPLFNFVVVFGFVYMLLIYSIEFIKEGEL